MAGVNMTDNDILEHSKWLNGLNKVKIYQDKIDDEHNDSFWYDGLIATKYTLNNMYKLIACGEIKIIQNDKKGNYKGMYDVKARDNFDTPKNDTELEKCYNNENGYVMIYNNWFEILDENGDSVADIYGNYDDAIEALKEMTYETV